MHPAIDSSSAPGKNTDGGSVIQRVRRIACISQAFPLLWSVTVVAASGSMAHDMICDRTSRAERSRRPCPSQQTGAVAEFPSERTLPPEQSFTLETVSLGDPIHVHCDSAGQEIDVGRRRSGARCHRLQLVERLPDESRQVLPIALLEPAIEGDPENGDPRLGSQGRGGVRDTTTAQRVGERRCQ